MSADFAKCKIRTTSTVLFIIICLGFAVSVLISKKENEPTWKGKPLVEWLEGINPHISSIQEQSTAIEAIRNIGTNGIPVLMKELCSEQGFFSSRPQRRRAAIRAFEILGEEAKVAIPLLEQAIQDPDVTIDAARVLSGFGIDGAESLARMLTNHTDNVRSTIIALLSEMGTNANIASPALLQCISSTNEVTAYQAAGALHDIGADPTMVVPSLLKNLTSSSGTTRGASAYALGFFVDKAVDTVPVLEQLVSDSDQQVVAAVSNALSRLRRTQSFQE